MTKTKTTLKCRIIEYDVFEKLETSVGLVWPAGQVFDFQPGLQALQVRPGQAAGQARLEKKWPVGSSDAYFFYLKKYCIAEFLQILQEEYYSKQNMRFLGCSSQFDFFI